MDASIVLSETRLIQCAAKGDRTAFGEIYTRYLNPIYRYVFYRVGDDEDAEDLTEQVFLKAWQSIPGYKDQGLKLTSWLYRIAHNVVIDHFRKCMAAKSVAEDCQTKLGEETLQSIKLTDEIEDSSALAQAISKLSIEQQQIIILRFIEGLSHAEISPRINKTEGACRMLQARALIALYKQLNDLGG